MRHIQLRRGVAHVLTFVNTVSEINKEPGRDITVWAHRESVQDMVHENNENASGQRADVPDVIVSGRLKVHIGFTRPLCITRVFLDALEQQKLTNDQYLESLHPLEESESREEVRRDSDIASRGRGTASTRGYTLC